ncbi:importin subunit alpha [Olea europaea subsp. europaea]|uniref:Importin subunit alpha n=1 Tax=Olea europaea subsp. europaea TaxID=158383 RepID=A0A8S0QNR2_OLEEU|nr:importin subunit alpha [Olea europaea subsp. europaea]
MDIIEQLKPALLPLAHLIHTDDEEVLSYACWAMYDLTCETEDIIQVVIDASVFPRLFQLLRYPPSFVCVPAMYNIVDIISYVDDIQIQVIIENGALFCLRNFLTQDYENSVKEGTCWIISELIKRTKDNFQAVIEAGIFSPLPQLIQNAEFELKREAARTICYATSVGTIKEIKYLVHEGRIKALCDLLVSPNQDSEVEIIEICLIGLKNILNFGQVEKNRGNTKDENVFAQMIDDAGGLQKIKSLQTHDNKSHPEMIAGVWSNDGTLQLKATTQFRKLLSVDQNPPIEEVIHSGVVPRFVDFLARYDYPQLQFEAAWALTNIASGTSDNTKVVIDHGAVPIFVRLLSSPSDDVRERAVWALGIVAGGLPKYRDLVLSYGTLIPLLAQFNDKTKPSMLRNATWTLSNCCGGKPQPQFEQVKPALLTLAHLIHTNDEVILTDSCWALSYLSDGTNVKIQAVIRVWHPSPSVLIPALRTLGNIVTGDDIQTQAVIEAGFVSPLLELLQSAEFEIKQEAAWVISNATSGGTHEQIKFLGHEGCIKPLCDLLVSPNEVETIRFCLAGLENILEVGEAEKHQDNAEDVNVFAQMISDARGLQKIKNLQTHDDGNIREKAVKMLETYWQEEDDEQLYSGDAPQFECLLDSNR